MFRFTCFLLIFASLSLAACSSSRPQARLATSEKLAAIREPSSGQLLETVAAFIKSQGAPADSQYEFTRVDLDHDGRRDAIVMMKSPYNFWCNVNGCRMLVFQAGNDDFSLVSQIAPVRGPLIVSQNNTNGWRDLVVRVSGRMDWQAKNVALKYNGHNYPQQPDFQPPLQMAANAIAGISIFP
jgi:hypothetical protein